MKENKEKGPIRKRRASTKRKVEEKILSHIKVHGFTSREEIAAKRNEVGMEIGVGQVLRYIRMLTEKRLLRREGNIYVPTELSRKQPHL